MKVIDYFECDRKDYWLEEIGKTDWGAGKYLHDLIVDGKLQHYAGEDVKVLMLVDGEELISFCTYAKYDDIQPTNLTPWMGWVYTFPEKRGHHYVQFLFDEIEKIAKEKGVERLYISTNHVGLYEKYGCTFFQFMNDIGGEKSRVYIKEF